MRCKTFLVALLVLALKAQAVHVSESEAADAASAWAGAGEALGTSLGTNVESVREHPVTDGYSFYAVKLDGGTVIMTSDTDLEPVIAFSSSGDIDLSEGSPLLDLLRRDVAARAAFAGMSARRSLATSAPTASTPVPSASPSSLWSALLRRRSVSAQSSPSPKSLSTLESASPLHSISDVRVAPLVKTKWNQYNVNDDPCYNYYTPNNWYCGCSATSLAQIMRYFEFPKAEVQPQEFECKVADETTMLSMQGGIYDWDSMTLDPQSAATLTEENRKAIGKLTSDVGIALKSKYGEYVTGAQPDSLASALRDAFGYADAVSCYKYAGLEDAAYNSNPDALALHDHALRGRVILANLDARQPVQLSIYGFYAGHVGDLEKWAGHSVVADGYGYQTVDGVETEFVHINMGWGGIDDVWYNIPEIDVTKTGEHSADIGYTYVYLGGAMFNISTSGTAGLSILSGRLTDEDGAAVKGATVSVYGAGDTKVAETVSDENGIYFFKLTGDAEYSLDAVSDDGLSAEIESVFLPATTGLDDMYVVEDASNIGNSWGNNMILAQNGPAQKDPAQPLPVEFAAISEVNGMWTLVITTAVKKCWYSLYETDSLSGGFEIDGLEPVLSRQATANGEMTFERPANGPQLFWKVRAEPEDAH